MGDDTADISGVTFDFSGIEAGSAAQADRLPVDERDIPRRDGPSADARHPRPDGNTRPGHGRLGHHDTENGDSQVNDEGRAEALPRLLHEPPWRRQCVRGL